MARTRIDYDGRALPDRPRVSADDMAAELPEPETCGTCAYVARCLVCGYTASRERTSCDFLPVRFAPAAREGAGPTHPGNGCRGEDHSAALQPHECTKGDGNG